MKKQQKNFYSNKFYSEENGFDHNAFEQYKSAFDSISKERQSLDEEFTWDWGNFHPLIEKYIHQNQVNYFDDSDIPGLDEDFYWDISGQQLKDQNSLKEEIVDTDNFAPGDLVIAGTYQEVENEINLRHKYRPFLIIYINYRKQYVYGYSLGTQRPNSILPYLIPVNDWSRAGLNSFGYIAVNYIRGVSFNYIRGIIGHITEEIKNDILDKLYDIQNNPEKYPDFKYNDKLEQTIVNIERIDT